MTLKVFEDFVRKLDKQMKTQKRKIILFVDQCTAHIDLKLKNVRVEFFPANCTSKLQPCDLEVMVIRSFKVAYGKRLVQKTLIEMEKGNLADASKQRINVLEAMHFISSAWNMVTSLCVAHSFFEGGFPRPPSSMETPQEIMDAADVPISGYNLLSNEVNFKDYVDCDESIVTSEMVSVPSIADIMDSSSEEEIDTTEEISEPFPSFNEALSGLNALKN